MNWYQFITEGLLLATVTLLIINLGDYCTDKVIFGVSAKVLCVMVCISIFNAICIAFHDYFKDKN